MPVNGRRTRPNKPNNAKIQTKRLAIASCSCFSLRVVIMSAVLLDKGEQYDEIFSPPPPRFVNRGIPYISQGYCWAILNC